MTILNNREIAKLYDCPNCKGRSKVCARFSEGNVFVLKCRQCQLGYLRPEVDDLTIRNIYSSGDYFSEGGSGYEDYEGQETSLRLTFRKLLKSMERQKVVGGSLFEIGCGFGYFLDEAREFFLNVSGTEMDPIALKRSQSQGVEVKLSSLEDLSDLEQFDVVCMIQVIEHISDPAVAIQKMKSLIKPGGALLLVTPDFNSPLRMVLRRRWPSYKIPEHVFYFNKHSLSKILNDNGCDKITWLKYPHAFPLKLIFSKFGLRVPSAIGDIPVWIPRTSIAAVAYFDS